jgi:hypothetical protein
MYNIVAANNHVHVLFACTCLQKQKKLRTLEVNVKWAVQQLNSRQIIYINSALLDLFTAK